VLLLCGVVGLVAMVAARTIGGYLAPSDPARGHDGQGARTLVVEGWLDESELNQALATFRRGGYRRIVTAGGPIDSWQEGVVWPTFAERAASYLQRHGVAEYVVVAAPAPQSAQDRTFLSAVVVRERLRRADPDLDAVDLFSSGAHARRSRLAYRMAFGPAVEVGIVAATPRHYDVERWWTTSEGTKTVLGELLGLAWTECCFWPGAPDPAEAQPAKPAP
jgi:hypothetical protein